MESLEMILLDWHNQGLSKVSLILGFVLGMLFTYSIYLFKESIKDSKKFLGKWFYAYATKKLEVYSKDNG